MPSIMHGNLNYSGGGGGASAVSNLTDVELISLANGQILKYNSTTQKWENADESGGTFDYSDLINKPSVNNVTLTGNKTSADLGLANASDIPTKVSDLTNDSNFVSDSPAFTEASTRTNILSGETFAVILGKIKKFFTDLKAVAFSGSYNDLTDSPTIPSATSDLVNDSGFVESSDLATVATSGDYVDLLNTPTIPSISANPQSPTAVLNGIEIDGTAYEVQGTGEPNVQSDWNETDSTSDAYIQNKPTLATVATSGNYNDLSNKPAASNFSGVAFYSGNSGTATHDANVAVDNGHYYYYSNGPATSLGATTTDGALYVQSYSSSWVAQIAQDFRNGRLFVRGKNNGTWTSWLRLALFGETAATIGRSGDVNYPMTFYWSGQSGQPTWLWGGNDGTNMYVYNPSNFSVSYARSATNASSASTAGSADWCYYVWNSHTLLEKSGGNTRMIADNSHNVTIQSDCNLVVYRSGSSAVWSSGTSSKRFKHNIQSMTEERARKILDIRAVTFDWNDDQVVTTQKNDNAGVIAEEVSQVIPDVVVFEPTDDDDDLKVERRVEYERFTPYLIKMVQMQQEQIEALMERVEILERRLYDEN